MAVTLVDQLSSMGLGAYYACASAATVATGNAESRYARSPVFDRIPKRRLYAVALQPASALRRFRESL